MRELYKKFFDTLYTFFVFLPYYFSVDQSITHYFTPYHRVLVFSKNRLSSRIWSYVISTVIGVALRTSLLAGFLIVFCVYVIICTVATVAFVLASPVCAFYVLFVSDSTANNSKLNEFIKSHTLNPKNIHEVERWYHSYTISQNIKNSLRNKLFAMVPLGADWAYGYTPTLLEYGFDITKSRSGPNLYGRQSEIADIVFLLTKSTYSNVLLLGSQSIGKNSLVHILAQKIATNQISPKLKNHKVIELDVERILGLTEDKIKPITDKIFYEAEHAGNIVLYLPDITKYLIAKVRNNPFPFIIEQALKNNNLKLIATSTSFDYELYMAPQKLSTYFEQYKIQELDQTKTKEFLLWQAHVLESKYNVVITYEAILECLSLASNLIHRNLNPEKTIGLLVDSCVSASRQDGAHPGHTSRQVTPSLVAETLYKNTNIPVFLTPEHKNSLIQLESKLNDSIIGQQKAIEQITTTIKSTVVTIGKSPKPICSLLLLGSSGVGKTETAKNIFSSFFDVAAAEVEGKSKFVRIDCNELTTDVSIETLIGSVTKGTDSDFMLDIRGHDSGVILFDEIEKAHPSIQKSILSLLDEGYISDYRAEPTWATGYIIIATSNAASSKLSESRALTTDQIAKILQKEGGFTSEFLNRFTEIVLFERLSLASCQEIAKKYVVEVAHRDRLGALSSEGTKALERLVRESYSTEYGAREIRRIVDKFASSYMVKKILG